MSDTISGLRRKINSAQDLQSVVRSMKALAASSIGQYENSVRALADYSRTVDLGLRIAFQSTADNAQTSEAKHGRLIHVILFGSDQGLVGQFNDVITDYMLQQLANFPATPKIWAVGERVHARIADSGRKPAGFFSVPNSVKAITRLVGDILLASEQEAGGEELSELHLFYNNSTSSATYSPTTKRLLPLDEEWRKSITAQPWPSNNIPQLPGNRLRTLRALISEHLFISLFRASAESLASENAARLAAMERADRNIDELLETLSSDYHQLRQSAIDEELFDVIAGYEALAQ